MKLIQTTAILLVLTAALMTGCRNRNDTTVPSTSAPTTAATTVPRQTTPSTTPSTMPMPLPSVTVPQGTDTSPATNGTDGILDPSNGSMNRGHGSAHY